MLCTLCHSSAHFYCEDKKRRFFRCSSCDLIFAEPSAHLSVADEKFIYELHENDPHDPHYRRFLAQLTEPLLIKLSPGMHGLDFGCGPGPALHLMLEAHGMTMAVYDLFYTPDTGQLSQKYDFVTCTEVVEHFNHPSQSWPELINTLKADGWLGVMTWLFTKDSTTDFLQWSYPRDPTHVSFYTPKTMHWLATQFQLKMEIVSDRVILFN